MEGKCISILCQVCQVYRLCLIKGLKERTMALLYLLTIQVTFAFSFCICAPFTGGRIMYFQFYNLIVKYTIKIHCACAICTTITKKNSDFHFYCEFEYNFRLLLCEQ